MGAGAKRVSFIAGNRQVRLLGFVGKQPSKAQVELSWPSTEVPQTVKRKIPQFNGIRANTAAAFINTAVSVRGLRPQGGAACFNRGPQISDQEPLGSETSA